MGSYEFQVEAGRWIASRRRDGGLTQEGLSSRSNISIRQIQRIEQGSQKPTIEQLEQIASVLSMNEASRRHLLNITYKLRNIAHSLPDDIDATIVEKLNPHLAALVDGDWDIYAANDSYKTTFPGICEYGNVLLWLFSSCEARESMVKWKEETELTVSWWKYNLSTRGQSSRFDDLYEKLRSFSFFRECWDKPRIESARNENYMWIYRDGEVKKIAARLYSSALGDGNHLFVGVQ
ncbi:helix-turn-helix domain-containing protein [Corynebacterium bovis]|nr:helix-turn-helix domain-containing protein [Corynebacterium bovis]